MSLNFTKYSKEIDILQEEDTCYSISPYYFTYNEKFSELEDYLIKYTMEDYLKKVKNIIFKIITFYDEFEITLAEFPTCGLHEFKDLESKSLKDFSYSDLDKILTYIQKNDISKFIIYFPTINMQIFLGGYFEFIIFGNNDKFLEHIKIHANIEGLFFKKLSN